MSEVGGDALLKEAFGSDLPVDGFKYPVIWKGNDQQCQGWYCIFALLFFRSFLEHHNPKRNFGESSSSISYVQCLSWKIARPLPLQVLSGWTHRLILLFFSNQHRSNLEYCQHLSSMQHNGLVTRSFFGNVSALQEDSTVSELGNLWQDMC